MRKHGTKQKDQKTLAYNMRAETRKQPLFSVDFELTNKR